MKNNALLSGFLIGNLIIATPCMSLALELEDFSVPQGETLELTVPRFEYSEATGNYDGKTFPFYPITQQIPPTAPISRAEFVQLIYQNQPLTTAAPTASAATTGGATTGGATPPSPPTYPPSPNAGASASDTIFLDISSSNPYISAIEYASSTGLVHGYEDGLFHPYDTITRGQAAKIIMNAYHPARTPEIQPPFFPDVPLDYSLRDEVYAAVRAGIFRGYPDGLMRPNHSINFEEAQLIIDRAGKFSENLNRLTERPAFRSYLGIHRLSKTGNKPLTITLKNQAAPPSDPPTASTALTTTASITTVSSTITVTKQEFTTVRFSLSTGKMKLFEKTYQDNTWALIDAAKTSTHPTQLWKGPFIIPATGETTLGFGDKLYINGVYSGSHFGIDYAAPEGTPVLAANTGIVTLASDTPAYGNTIVIDHGQNIFTMYLHLKDLQVQNGDTVQKGAQIATMGQTGIATGPHLHFTNFIGDIIVDSTYWYNKQ